MLERHDTLFLCNNLEKIWKSSQMREAMRLLPNSSVSRGDDFPSQVSHERIQRVSGTGIFLGEKLEVGNEKRNLN